LKKFKILLSFGATGSISFGGGIVINDVISPPISFIRAGCTLLRSSSWCSLHLYCLDGRHECK